jgi:hypothetical protein
VRPSHVGEEGLVDAREDTGSDRLRRIIQ